MYFTINCFSAISDRKIIEIFSVSGQQFKEFTSFDSKYLQNIINLDLFINITF